VTKYFWKDVTCRVCKETLGKELTPARCDVCEAVLHPECARLEKWVTENVCPNCWEDWLDQDTTDETESQGPG
jgi:hypothetical protein